MTKPNGLYDRFSGLESELEGLSEEERKQKIKAINKERYGWSKYGGGNHGLYQGEVDTTWCCQLCGQEQPKALPPFMYPIEPRIYIRICGNCQAIAIRTKVTHYTQIISIVRRYRD